MVLKIVYSTECPFSRKIRIALAEKGVPFELQTDVPWNHDSQSHLWNPLRKIPILLKHNGTSVYGSHLILEWIEAEYPPPRHPPIYPQVKEREILCKQLEVLADGICEAAVLLWVEQQRQEPSAAWTERQRVKIDAALHYCLGWIKDREFFFTTTKKITVAEIATGSMLSYLKLRFPEDWVRWEKLHPNLVTFHERLEARPAFQNNPLVDGEIKNEIV